MTYKATSPIALAALLLLSLLSLNGQISQEKMDDLVRAEQIKEMKFGMFICWSFSTFSGREWTPTLNKDASYFTATGCDTDKWCTVAKDAGMNYILFLPKHHDWCSTFAANISTIHMVGLAANGFKDGIVWGNFEWMATFLLIILALLFAPFYFRNRISTLPEFLEKRYGRERGIAKMVGIDRCLPDSVSHT